MLEKENREKKHAENPAIPSCLFIAEQFAAPKKGSFRPKAQQKSLILAIVEPAFEKILNLERHIDKSATFKTGCFHLTRPLLETRKCQSEDVEIAFYSFKP